MTEYRVVSDGTFYYLQYLKVCQVLLFTLKVWTDVPVPYYDQFHRDFLVHRYDASLNSLNTENLKEWADKHPDIEEYLTKEYEPEMQRLKKEVMEYRMEKDRQSKQGVNLGPQDTLKRATVDWRCSKLEEKK